jgi:hypothetical protein
VARLIHLTRRDLVVAAAGFEPVPQASPEWKARRPRETSTLTPWFELTPTSPWIDSRVSERGAPGVAAALQTFGGLTGPDLRAELYDSARAAQVVLGGNPIAPGTPPPSEPHGFRRQCAVRLAVAADGIEGDRQCLVLVAVHGFDGAIVQSFAGLHAIGEAAVFGEERVAVLVDVPESGELALDLWFRLCATRPSSRLGVQGIDGFLL